MGQDPRPTALYLSPFVPDVSGGGAVMRAAQHLRMLSQSHDVYLVVAAYPVPMNAHRLDDRLAALCAFQHRLPWPFANTPRAVQALPAPANWVREVLKPSHNPPMQPVLDGICDALPIDRFDLLFCFRRTTGRLAMSLLDQGRVSASCRILDLDDLDDLAMRREADLNRRRLGIESYRIHRLQAWRVASEMRYLAQRFDISLVCSHQDRTLLHRRVPRAQLGVLPNTVAGPDRLDHEGIPGRLLLVGSMSYAPNADGARWFCEAVVPHLKATEATVSLSIVGRGPPSDILAMDGRDGVRVYPDVPSVQPYYADAQISIVPIRYGGGTRIKILESLAYGRPVVSTTIGAEGLDLTPEHDILLADTPEAFARQIRRLVSDRGLWQRLRDNGLETIRTSYSLDHAMREFRLMLAP